MHIRNDILHKDEGVVLVMVLIVLVATIIMGIMLSRSSFFEAKIAGNQRTYKNDFYAAEGASDYIISEFDSIASTLALNMNTTYDFSSYLPTAGSIDDANITIRLLKTGSPPTGSGTGVAHTVAYYYRINTTLNNQDIEIGIWKAFPKQQ